MTIDFLKVLGLQPVRGRSFTLEETKPNGPRVAMIGEALWHERFGGRADVLGKELRLNSRVYTVVGVLPKAAEFPGGVRLWVPMQDNPTDRDGYSYDGLGRLKPGISAEQATPIYCVCSNRFRQRQGAHRRHSRELRAQFTREFGTIASTLGAAVALLLAVACANVAALMLARALARRREIGIRLAVGASRVRLLRQLLVENILLSVAGGALGLVVGHWAIQLLITSLPDQAPGWTTFTLDTRMVITALAVSSANAVLPRAAPHAMNSDVRGAMSAATGDRRRQCAGAPQRALLAGVRPGVAMFVCGGPSSVRLRRVRNTDPGSMAERADHRQHPGPPGGRRIAFWFDCRSGSTPSWRRQSGGGLCARGAAATGDGSFQPRGAPRGQRPESVVRIAWRRDISAMGIRLEGRPVLHRCRAADAFDARRDYRQ